MGAAPSRRDLILDVARTMFVGRGYDGTTIGDIAAKLDISKAAVSYHFPSKADFLDALLDPLLTELTEIIARHPAPSWPTGARQLFGEYLTALVAEIDLATWLDTDPALRVGGRHGTRLRELDLQLARSLTGNSRRHNDRMRALAAIGGIWRPIHHETADEIEAHLDEIVDAALVSYAPLTEP